MVVIRGALELTANDAQVGVRRQVGGVNPDARVCREDSARPAAEGSPHIAREGGGERSVLQRNAPDREYRSAQVLVSLIGRTLTSNVLRVAHPRDWLTTRHKIEVARPNVWGTHVPLTL